MRVLILEDNLLWSARLQKSIVALGDQATTTDRLPEVLDFDVAIVNLGSKTIPAQEVVPALRAGGVAVIAHAGHKEKDLLQMGREIECDCLATNSQLTWKIGELLDGFRGPKEQRHE
jgi:protein-L-isoaspartate O-methyltransferase